MFNHRMSRNEVEKNLKLGLFDDILNCEPRNITWCRYIKLFFLKSVLIFIINSIYIVYN